MKSLMICSFLFLCFVTTPAQAQFDSSSLQGTGPILTTQPQYPQPGTDVIVKVSYNNNTYYGATLTWVVDGVIVPNSKNQRSIEIVAGESGVDQEINIIFTSPTGARTVASKILTPLWLDIIIEPQTHVPEFYQGRALPSIESTVFATALISGADGLMNPDLVYTWKINRTVLDRGPVRGRNIMTFDMPIGNSAILSVEVQELLDPATGQTPGRTIAHRLIKIPSVRPTLLFYEVNTLLGISQKPISKNLSLVGESGTVRAEPFNLDSNVYNNPARHFWTVNDVETSNSGINANPYEVMIAKTGSTGRTFLEFHVRDTTQVLQGVEDRILINL
jgi:hypothetical protein